MHRGTPHNVLSISVQSCKLRRNFVSKCLIQSFRTGAASWSLSRLDRLASQLLTDRKELRRWKAVREIEATLDATIISITSKCRLLLALACIPTSFKALKCPSLSNRRYARCSRMTSAFRSSIQINRAARINMTSLLVR